MSVLQVNKNEFKISNLNELENLLEKVKEDKYCEIWLTNEEDKHLVVLKNGDNVFLTFIDNENGSDFYSVNPENENSNEELDFYLSNGQKDYYPIKWIISLKKGFNALKHFYITNGLDQNVIWSDNLG